VQFLFIPLRHKFLLPFFKGSRIGAFLNLSFRLVILVRIYLEHLNLLWLLIASGLRFLYSFKLKASFFAIKFIVNFGNLFTVVYFYGVDVHIFLLLFIVESIFLHQLSAFGLIVGQLVLFIQLFLVDEHD